ncbi:symplekin isoform X2 [Macadamia integrifolia]|uniref:symplekin isoform X2 n=1 Tax=Macadamia integrifolia TaxID=60698 RepID=UPI001C4FA9B2|nr:symplekin isoform X2 [Macadamia integrifolia]
MAGASREQALSLIAAVKNHGDLAVKLSSLKQVKEILLSVEPSFAAEIFPYLTEIRTSPESLVRKSLVELVEDLGLKVMEHSSILMPVLLTLLKDDAPVVVRQSIVTGTYFYCSILEKMALQFHQSGRVEKWLEELWMWMAKFKDDAFGIALEPGSVGTKLLAMKFLETYILLFTPDADDPETSIKEGKGRTFNISWVVGGHPVLDTALFTLEANKALGLLLDQLQSASSLCGSLIIAVINCLAAIARRRPLHYSSILSALLCFDPNFEALRGGHTASIQYSLRTAFLGFLRCTHPVIIESRERLLRALRAMNAGDAADQVIRQVDRMLKNTERASRDARFGKDDQPSSPLPSGDLVKKRTMLQDNDGSTNIDEVPGKRTRYGPQGNSAFPGEIPDDTRQDDIAVNGIAPKLPLLDSDLTPVEQMIAMIGALLAQGERGAESLEILISKIHPDLLADIVIANMRHLPKNPPPLLSRLGNGPVAPQTSSSSTSSQVAPSTPIISVQHSAAPLQVAPPFPSAVTSSTSMPDVSIVPSLPADYKRDPRRDPRRLDPRRVAVPGGVQSVSVSVKEDTDDMQSGIDSSASLGRPLPPPVVMKVESASVPLVTKSEFELSESPVAPVTDQPTSEESLEVLDEIKKEEPVQEVKVITTSDVDLSPVTAVVQDAVASIPTDITMTEGVDPSCSLESDQHSPAGSSTSASEETSQDFPLLPSYIELTEEQRKTVTKLAIERIIGSCKKIQLTDCSQTRMALLARLVAQMDADVDVIVMLQKHLVLDFQHQKGHELVMHVLYHLHTLMISESDEHSSFAATMYEKFLLAVARSLWDTLPASDKSFSRLLGEVPHLPDSALKMLEELCCVDGSGLHVKDVRDGDRVTQGLGAVWSLILGRPLNRQGCLNIALKCAVHSQDEVRAKAIRLVANKLYLISYVSESIEQFATAELLSVVDQHVPDTDPSPSGSTEQRTEGNLGTQETSISGSHNSEPGASENDSVKDSQVIQSVPAVSLSQAQRHMSLFFALCTKKPSLLKLVFDVYGRAPKSVKQAVHRHIPILVRTLGASKSELLHIISDPPQGSENLLMLVLQILTEETTPSADLIATVKHLYEAKLKDAAILIPMLSSLSKDEVLPIFPRLVDLPLEKFQAALARILQGSAHTGPALTPAEVLVAIHDINPDKDGIALKKVTWTISLTVHASLRSCITSSLH